MSCEICPLVVGQMNASEQESQKIEVYDETLDLVETFEACADHANEILERIDYHERRKFGDGTTYIFER